MKNNSDNGEGFMGGLLDAMAERQKADIELKKYVMKAKAQSMIRQQEAQAKQRMLTQTPEQQYLRRRALEQNPLMGLGQSNQATLVQDGNEMGGGKVEFDPSIEEATPTLNEKTGLYSQKQLTPQEIEDNKGKAFMAMYNGLIKSGRKPSDWMTKAANNIQDRMNKRLGYVPDKTEKEYKPNTPTRKFLENVSKGMEEGVYQTQEDALGALDSNNDALEIAGADINYIRDQITKTLPSQVIPEKKKFMGFIGDSNPQMKKKDGVWYKKVQGGWVLASQDDLPEDMKNA